MFQIGCGRRTLLCRCSWWRHNLSLMNMGVVVVIDQEYGKEEQEEEALTWIWNWEIVAEQRLHFPPLICIRKRSRGSRKTGICMPRNEWEYVPQVVTTLYVPLRGKRRDICGLRRHRHRQRKTRVTHGTLENLGIAAFVSHKTDSLACSHAPPEQVKNRTTCLLFAEPERRWLSAIAGWQEEEFIQQEAEEEW